MLYEVITIMILALSIAFVTPPVCANIFVAQTMTGLSSERIIKAALPFVATMIVALIIIGFSPWISEFLVAALK